MIHGPSAPPPEDIIGQLRELIGPYKTPRRIIASPDPLPRTASAKIRRHGLQDVFKALESRIPNELPTA
jgi:fatty-acyl-CoA synthase